MAGESNAFRTGAPHAPGGADAGVTELLARPLRANPLYQLVLHDRLPDAERAWLARAARDPDHYGVLRPLGAAAAGADAGADADAGAGGGIKLVDRDTALLFLTLERPGPLPGYVRSRLGDGGAAAVAARLVADGVIEIEREAGVFVSGAAAMALLRAAGGAGGAGPAEEGRIATAAAITAIAELSRCALRRGQQLVSVDGAVGAGRLAHFLYTYHRLPLTPGWQRRLATADAVRQFLGIGPGGVWRGPLERHWQEVPAGPAAAADAAAAAGTPGPAWLRWHPRRAAPAAAVDETPHAYKLYVSVAPDAMPAAFGAILAGLAAAGAPGFKVGASASGLLRPDKAVAYFPRFEDLAAAAHVLAGHLDGVAAHGVPFTAEIAGGGVLSWGVDPPPGAGGTAQWAGRGSWRQWLTQRLAEAMLAGVGRSAGVVARQPPPPARPDLVLARTPGVEAAATPQAAQLPEPSRPVAMEAWEFAVERLRLAGVDTATWAPGALLWRWPEEARGR
jgi:hypothetical protein